MALKFFAGQDNPDHNMTPWCWLNTSSQTHVFKSFLEKQYPALKESQEKFTVPPGKLAFLPHQYYTAHTRDDSPIVGKRMTRNEAVEAFAPGSYVSADSEHLNRHEKKV